MARGCSESDSEEERHDRFRSERNTISTNSSKSLFSTGLDQINKSRSPLTRLNSPCRRDRRSPTKRSRSRSSRRSKERRKSRDRRDSKEKSKKEEKNSSSSRSSSRSKETSRRSDGKDSRSETRRRSDSKTRRRSTSKEKKRRRENKRNYLETGETNDTFLLRFERRRPSVENEVVENTVTYRDSSPEINERLSLINSNKYESSRSHKKEKKRKRSRGEAEEGELISEEENNCFGPALPPRLDDDELEEDEEIKDMVAEGPALPPGFNKKERDAVFGPQLPHRHCKKSKSQENTEKSTNLGSNTTINTDDENRNEKRLIGPMLPPTKDRLSLQEDDNEVALYGPALPPQSSSSTSSSSSSSVDVDEEDLTALIGPLPKGMELDDNVQRILEERAQYLRKQLENKDTGEFGDEKGGRESWMLELPEGKTSAQLGLGPRKFKIREGPDMSDRSSWTDVPGSKKNKKDNSDKVNDESRRIEITTRNEEMENLCRQASRDETSLLELHQKELKKKRKKEHEMTGGKVERRPFSREIDLQTNRFDDAQKKSIINKAQLLNSRFASGESKYL